MILEWATIILALATVILAIATISLVYSTKKHSQGDLMMRLWEIFYNKDSDLVKFSKKNK